jgi:predicted permease
MSSEDLDDELSSHLEFQVRKNMAAGMSEAEARRRARIEFGGVDVTKEQCRDVDPWRHVGRMRRDFKYALRSLWKSPVFTSVAILILAVGIGATVGAFSVVDAMLYRPVGVTHPGELVQIAAVGKQGRPTSLLSTILDPLKSSTWLSGVCGFTGGNEGLQVNGAPRTVQLLIFSEGCFRTLGVAMQLGRPLAPADDRRGAPPVAVISGELWRKAFGGRQDVIGQSVQLSGVSFAIVGVVDDRFQGVLLGFPGGLIIPMNQAPSNSPGPRVWSVDVIGRRAPGVSEKQAAAGLAAQRQWLMENSVPLRFNAARRQRYLNGQLMIVSGATGPDHFVRQRFGGPLRAIFAICAVILVIACVNLAGLTLARTLRRRKEVAVRLALGASRAQVAVMLALESILLVLAGSALSAPFALAIDRLVLSQAAEMFGLEVKLGFDARSTLFWAAVTMATAVALAAASVWQARRLCAGGSLHAAGVRVVAGHGAAQKILIAAQIALTLALVAGAGLCGASLRGLYGVHLGVDTRHVWDVKLSSSPMLNSRIEPFPYYRDLVEQVGSVPGVRGAVLTNFVPFYNRTQSNPAAPVENSEPGQELEATTVTVSDGFFSMMGMRLVEGRDFERNPVGGEEPEAVVSQSLAAHWGGGAAILGRHVRLGGNADYQRLRVVGVVSDAEMDLADVAAFKPFTVYVNSWQHPTAWAGYPILLVKAAGSTLPLARLRQVVNGFGREYADRTRTLDAEMAGALVEDRVMAYLSAAFGGLALLLAATGLFGLLSYQVANRTSEIGIRMALGARRAQIQWMVVRQIAGLMAGGGAAGLALALLAGRALQGLLFGVKAGNPVLLGGAMAALLLTALVAAWLPARRAASVDPQVALRHE